MNSEFLGYEVSTKSPSEIAADVVVSIERNEKRWLACINPHSYVEASRRQTFAEALRTADWLIPDGIGVVLGSRITGGTIKNRVTGYEVFSELLNSLQARGHGTVYFLGASEATLAALRRRVGDDFPAVHLVGTYSPPFKGAFDQSDEDAMVAAINSVRPEVLWVGLTAPKQEELIVRLLPQIDVCFAGAIGAVFDFYAYNRRASSLAQRFKMTSAP